MLLFRRSKDVMRALRQNAAESYKLKRRRWLARRSRMIDTLIRNNVCPYCDQDERCPVNREALMSHMLEARWFGGAPDVRYTSKSPPLVDDPLGAARGIALETLHFILSPSERENSRAAMPA